jgi:hypothetical protein
VSLPDFVARTTASRSSRGATNGHVVLGALYGFYNSSESAELLADAGFEGFSDLAYLDEARRRVIASLKSPTTGW